MTESKPEPESDGQRPRETYVAATKLRYRGRGQIFVWRRRMLTAFAILVVIWQFASNGLFAVFSALMLVILAGCIRLWRAWPYLRLDDRANPQVLLVRNWLKVHEFSIDSNSTMFFRASRLMSEPTRKFEVQSKNLTVRSRVHLSGEEGFAEAEQLATAWSQAGGNLVDQIHRYPNHVRRDT